MRKQNVSTYTIILARSPFLQSLFLWLVSWDNEHRSCAISSLHSSLPAPSYCCCVTSGSQGQQMFAIAVAATTSSLSAKLSRALLCSSGCYRNMGTLLCPPHKPTLSCMQTIAVRTNPNRNPKPLWTLTSSVFNRGLLSSTSHFISEAFLRNKRLPRSERLLSLPPCYRSPAEGVTDGNKQIIAFHV